MTQSGAKVLNLSENVVTNIGFEYLLKNLTAHPSLEKLHLRKNYTDEKVFDILKKYLPRLKKLKYFNLKDNRITFSKTNQKQVAYF